MHFLPVFENHIILPKNYNKDFFHPNKWSQMHGLLANVSIFMLSYFFGVIFATEKYWKKILSNRIKVHEEVE